MVRTFFFYVECNTKYDKYKLYNYYFCCIFKKMLKYKINITIEYITAWLNQLIIVIFIGEIKNLQINTPTVVAKPNIIKKGLLSEQPFVFEPLSSYFRIVSYKPPTGL